MSKGPPDPGAPSSPRQLVALERRGKVAFVQVQRPDVLNALNPPLLQDLDACFRALRSDPTVAAAVLSGAGRAFMAGGDFRAMDGMEDEEFAGFIEAIQELTRLLRTAPFPVICVLHGPTVGGGCEIACACDFRIASESATFAFPEAGLGLVATSGVLHLLPRLVGAGWAARLLLTGETVTAATALKIGLIEETVADEELLSQAEHLAERIAAADPTAIRLVKKGLNSPDVARGLEEALAFEAEAVRACLEDGEVRRRLRALVESRPSRDPIERRA